MTQGCTGFRRPFAAASLLGLLALFATPRAGAADPPPTYTLDKPARVSLAIYDEAGRLVRTLLYAEPHEPGQYEIHWDGLDDEGRPVPAGSYTYKLLKTPGLKAEYILSLGTNVLPEQNPNALSWVGRGAGASSVDVDEKGNMYLASVNAERCCTLLKIDLDEDRLVWGKIPRHPRYVAHDGEHVLALGHKIGRFSQTGSLLHYHEDDGATPYHIWNRDIIRPDSLLHEKDRAHDSEVIMPGNVLGHGGKSKKNRKAASPMNFDAAQGKVAVSYQAHDQVRVFDYRFSPMTVNDEQSMYFLKENYPFGPYRMRDEVARVEDTAATFDIAAPGAVAFGKAPLLYVAAPGKLVACNLNSGEQQLLVEDADLVAPSSMDYDPAGDTLLVAQNGEGAHNIRRYNAKTGAFVARYGRAEGRRVGPFDPTQFRDIKDVCADHRGGFIVVEGVPRRTVRFDADGNVLRQWFGGQIWPLNVAFEPDDPSIAYMPVDDNHLGRIQIDFDTRSWTLTHMFSVSGENGELTHNSRRWEVRRLGENDRCLVSRQGISPSVYSIDLDNGRIELVARAEGLGKEYFIDQDYNILVPDDPRRSDRVNIIPNTALHGQVPVWNKAAQTAYNTPLPASFEGKVENRVRTNSIYRDLGGDTYRFFGLEGSKDRDDVQGVGWPHGLVGSVRLTKWDADNRLEWNVGRHQVEKKFTPKPGHWLFPIRITGEVNDCIVAQDRITNFGQVWTKDGLYVGGLLADRVQDGLPDSYYRYVRYRGALVGDQLYLRVFSKNGDTYFATTGPNQSPVYKVHGWNDWQRERGQIAVTATAPHAKRDGQGLNADYFDNPDLRGEPVLSRVDPDIWFGPMFGDHMYVASGRRWHGEEYVRENWSTLLPEEKLGKQQKQLFKYQPETPQAPFSRDGFSVRWTGWIEPKFTEDYRLVLAVFGRSYSIIAFNKGLVDKRASDIGAKVRVWIDGELVLDRWDEIEMKPAEPEWGWWKTRYEKTEPIPMTAGEKLSIRIEFAGCGGVDSHCHLNWESFTQERKHVPSEFLYPNE